MVIVAGSRHPPPCGVPACGVLRVLAAFRKEKTLGDGGRRRLRGDTWVRALAFVEFTAVVVT